ncbi:MAG TPA: oligosaccharide flippase family protein [Ktedonosporobacter sp.]|nr:oligosaccharide flippase family protein [Ktedonosporobacter sp.]
MNILVKWIKKNITLLFNASSLIGTTLVNSGLGFVFWAIAAHRFSTEAIGIASASLNSMNLVGTFCILGMGTLLITEIPRKPSQARALTSTALLIVGCAGIVVGTVFVIVIPFIAHDLLILRESIGNAIIFVLGISLTAMVLTLDQALIGFLRGSVQLWRNIFCSIFKLALLVAVAFLIVQRTGLQIYATWALANILSLLALFGAVKAGKRSFRSYLPQWRLVRMLSLPGLQHHMLNMALQAPTLILPLLVTTLLSARTNGFFYIAWQLSNFLFMVPTALTTVLHATNSAKPQSLGQKMRVTIGIAAATGILANLVIQLFPQLILSIFGKSYAQEASWCLRILALAVFPLIIKNHYISVCRIHDRISSAMVGMIPGGLLELVAAALGAHFAGLTGLSLGWLCAICVEAIFMSPAILREFRSKESAVRTSQLEDLSTTATEPLWHVDTSMLPAMGTDYATLEAAWQQTSKLRALKLSQKMAAVQVEDRPSRPSRPSRPDRSSTNPGLKRTRLQPYDPSTSARVGRGVLTLPTNSPSDRSFFNSDWQDEPTNDHTPS